MNTIINNPWVKLAAVVGGSYLVYKHVKNPLVKSVALTAGGIALINNMPVVRDFVQTKAI